MIVFFFLFLITDLYFFIPAVIFIPSAELVIPIGMATNEANEEFKHNH